MYTSDRNNVNVQENAKDELEDTQVDFYHFPIISKEPLDTFSAF